MGTYLDAAGRTRQNARTVMTLPTGPAVTFLFTDIEGSTALERTFGSAAWAAVVARHDALLRGAIAANGGMVVKTEGDAFFASFGDSSDAAAAAIAAQRAITAEAWPDGVGLRIRMGLHVGEGRQCPPGLVAPRLVGRGDLDLQPVHERCR